MELCNVIEVANKTRMLFALFALLPSIAISAPVTRTNRATAQSALNLRVLEAAPYFHPYKAWKECVSTLANLSIQSGKQAEETTVFSVGSCTDEEQELRSIVAQNFGISGADQIISQLRAEQRATNIRLYQQFHPAVNGLYAQFSGWTIKKLQENACMATRAKQDMFSPSGLTIIRKNNEQFIAMVVGGQTSKNNSDLVSGSRTRRTVLLSNSRGANRSRLDLVFDILRDDGNLIFKLTADQGLINQLSPFDQLQIDNPDISKNAVFDFPEVEKVWYKLLECTS